MLTSENNCILIAKKAKPIWKLLQSMVDHFYAVCNSNENNKDNNDDVKKVSPY